MRALRRFALALTLASVAELWLAGAGARAAAVAAGASRATEYEVKATFLFNFLKFVAWPTPALASGATLDICVFGDSPIATPLEGFGGQTVDGHRLAVKRVIDPSDLQFCHLVFVSEAESPRAHIVLAATKNLGALTVGEQPDFLQRGGMINFVSEDNKVRFDINQAAAERVNLKISAHLLRLARQTGDGRRSQ